MSIAKCLSVKPPVSTTTSFHTFPSNLKKGTIPALFEWNIFSLLLSRLGIWERKERPPAEDDMEDDTLGQEADIVPEDHGYASAPDPTVVNLALEARNY